VARISERFVEVDGVRVFARVVDGSGTPVVFVHGNPTHSGDWVPFLARIDGPAIAFDMPGWGASATPDHREFDYTIDGLGRFFGRYLTALGVAEYSLVAHDWGVVSLLEGSASPERLRRLVLMNAVPLLPGFRWHWIARWLWRVPVMGELANLTTTKAASRLLSRQASGTPGPLPEEFIDSAWKGRGRGVWRPLLTLYRSADPEDLAAAGKGLAHLTCPGLVIWGLDSPSCRSASAAPTRIVSRTPSCSSSIAPATGHVSIARRSSTTRSSFSTADPSHGG
jgi:pimeloyl-ACP methyl ester carboxylesterase